MGPMDEVEDDIVDNIVDRNKVYAVVVCSKKATDGSDGGRLSGSLVGHGTDYREVLVHSLSRNSCYHFQKPHRQRLLVNPK